MVNRIDCVVFYDGLSSLFKTAVRSLTCDLTCSFPYSLPSRLSTSLSCSLSSSLPASLSSSLLCGFPANLLFSLLERHRHMCISHSTPGEALSRVHIPQPSGRGTVTCAYPTTLSSGIFLLCGTGLWTATGAIGAAAARRRLCRHSECYGECDSEEAVP